MLRSIMGPMGSAKSTTCIAEIMRRASEMPPSERDGVRRSRVLVVRNTFKELYETSRETFMQMFPPEDGWGDFQKTRMAYILSWIRADDNTRVRLEVLFRAMDDEKATRSLLSLELTGAWINESREVLAEGDYNPVGADWTVSKQGSFSEWAGALQVYPDGLEPSGGRLVAVLYAREHEPAGPGKAEGQRLGHLQPAAGVGRAWERDRGELGEPASRVLRGHAEQHDGGTRRGRTSMDGIRTARRGVRSTPRSTGRSTLPRLRCDR